MSGRERVWLAFAVFVVLLLAAMPFVAGWLSAPPDQPFSGILVEREDGFSYLANMRLGAGGDWLFQDVYAVRPHPKTPLYSVFMLLGHLVSPVGDARVPMANLSIMYTASRIVFGAIFLVMLYWFITLLVDDVAQRRLAWALIAMGGGLGWLMMLITGQALPLGAPPLDLYLGEASTVIPLLAYPHTLLGRAALLAGVVCLIRADERSDWRWAAAAGGLWLLAALAVPFHILVAGGLVGGWIVVRWLMTRQFSVRLVLMGLAAGIPGVILNVVTLAFIGTDPTYAAWTAQNQLPLPHVLHLLSAFGVQTALAIPAAIFLWREKAPRADLLIGWAVAAPFLMLIPLPFQLRFIEGFTIPVGILAVIGVWRIAAGRARLPALIGLFVLVLPTSLLLIAGGTASALGGFGRISSGQSTALEWLRTHAEPGSVVLSSDEFGVVAPAAAPLRAVLGHGFETPDFDATKASVASLYSGRLTGDAARAWVSSRHVRYVIFGPDEAALAGSANMQLVDVLALREVFADDSYSIYETGSP